VALALYGACWVLPILVKEKTGFYIGFDGARVAHEQFWDLLTRGPSIDSIAKVFETVFSAIGWLANELFVLGVATVRKWPGVAVRLLAFSLGIMVSWQIAFLDHFPLLMGYWFWVGAGALALWLAASRLAHEKGRGVGTVIAEPATLVLLLIPIVNAAIGVPLGAFK
jgi:hypothetical protein